MHRDTTTYGQGQREVWFGSVEWAEAAARDFQRRGYRRRTRGLVPGDVLVAETAEGFSLFWIPQDQSAPPSPGAPREAGSSQFTPRPLAGPWMGSNRPGVRASGPGGGPTETALVKLGAVLGF
jgi:hypothetical protein